MQTTIQKWGNSQGLRIGKELLKEAELEVGDAVEVSVRAGIILIAPQRQIRGKYKLEDLIARMPKSRRPRDTDWGAPVGKEVW